MEELELEQDEVCLTRTELEQWAIVSWAIWNARNKYCYVDTQAHPESILRSALSLLHEYQSLMANQTDGLVFSWLFFAFFL